MSDAKIPDKIIPFGKYKGQPLEVLSADPQYRDWLTSQPWFKERFANFYTVVVNNFSEPSCTPEHNRLQARFLDDAFCLKFFGLQAGRHGDLDEEDGASWFTPAESFDAISKGCLIADEYDAYAGIWSREIRTASEPPAHSKLKLLGASGKSLYRVRKSFESKGADVFLSITEGFRIVGLPTEHYRDWDDSLSDMDTHEYRIEIKPSLGDDYPAVLRQMKASACDVLVFSEFRSEAIGREELDLLFRHSNIKVCSFDEIDELPIFIPGNIMPHSCDRCGP